MSGWRPANGIDVARRRARLLARIRDYFDKRAVLEVSTPTLAPGTVTDPNIESIAVGERYLQTSPEYHMKRMLADGFPDIYSIAPAFRDGEAGKRHRPEFTLVEWYRRDFGLDDIVTDTIGLIAHALDRPALKDTVIRCDYAKAFKEVLKIDPRGAKVAALADIAGADARLRQTMGGRRDGWLDLLFATRIARGFPKDRLTVVSHFPASQAALARLCPRDDSVADRFEVFCGPIELANGYVELTDADEQSERMDRDIEIRATYKRRSVPRDERLIEALRAGLPPCAGVALGLERLHMIDAGTNDINDVVSFSE